MDIFGSLLGDIIADQLKGSVAPSIIKRVVPAVVNKVADDPVMQNQMNMESPLQSRVVVGGTIGMIGALIVAVAHLIEMLKSGNLDINMAMAEVGTIWGLGYALYGRLANGLKPLFSR